MKSKPLVVYLHRYPPEHEAVQFPGMRALLDHLLVKYDVLYVSMRGILPINPEVRRGLQIIELPMRINPFSGLSKLLKTGLFYLYLPVLVRKLKYVRPDLIICKEPLPFVPIWISSIGVPTIIGGVSDFWWRILLGGSSWGNRLSHCLERFEVRRWRRLKIAVIANTKAEADLIVRRGMDPAFTHIINTASPRGVFFPCVARVEREAMGFTNDDWVVAIHGTIRPGKGYSQLLEWWQALVKIHPNWHLLIIGGAGGEIWCQRLIHRLGLKANAHMTGWLPTQNEVNRYLNAADCLLVIRRNSDDNQGIIPSALYHSLATGKPTVATGLAGMVEIVRHGVDGYLFEPDNYDSFRTVLEYVAVHPDEAARIGQAGMVRERECFDPEISAAKTVEVIDRIILAGGPKKYAV